MSVLERSDTSAEPMAATPTRHLPGEVGVWVFILGDMAIFAVLFVTYLTGRTGDVDLFNSSQSALNPDFGLVNTLLLLTSSLLVVMGVRSVKERRGPGAWFFLGAIACGLAFSALKVIEYSDKASHGLTPATNDFFMYYFVLTGLHWFHVALGILVLIAMTHFARKDDLTDQQVAFVEGGACFWHMVDLLWIVLFPLLYLAH
jgi:nitric oxide reductase NorE protein